jgi:hypothetical protein
MTSDAALKVENREVAGGRALNVADIQSEYVGGRDCRRHQRAQQLHRPN